MPHSARQAQAVEGRAGEAGMCLLLRAFCCMLTQVALQAQLLPTRLLH